MRVTLLWFQTDFQQHIIYLQKKNVAPFIVQHP